MNTAAAPLPVAAWAGDPPAAKAAGSAVLAAAALVAAALLAEGLRDRVHKDSTRRARTAAPSSEARDLHAAAAALCASVLADSAVEHYRGSFENPGMLAPLIASALGVLVGGGAALGRGLPRRVRGGSYGLAAAVGIAGFGFHLYNLLRRPGGWSWLNLFYAAPLGAPGALVLGGTIGLAAERIASARAGAPPRIAGAPAGRVLCGVIALGLAGTVGEVGLLHYRGSFQNPFMWLPVSLPPVAAALTAKAATGRGGRRGRAITRAWLRLTALLGVAGVGFHAYGISRAMGGWRNWQQNVLDGPPLPAPPSFSALAFAALAALRLRDREDG